MQNTSLSVTRAKLSSVDDGDIHVSLILEDCSLQGLHARIVVEVSAQPGFAVGKMAPRVNTCATMVKRLIEMWR